jgi:hypothetical protein
MSCEVVSTEHVIQDCVLMRIHSDMMMEIIIM